MKIKVGDYVRVLIVGMNGYYTVDEINDDEYTVSQPYSGMSIDLTSCIPSTLCLPKRL